MRLSNKKSIATNIIISIAMMAVASLFQAIFYKYSSDSISDLSDEVKNISQQRLRVLLLPQYYQAYLQSNGKKKYQEHVLFREIKIYSEFIAHLEKKSNKQENLYTTNDTVIPSLLKQYKKISTLALNYNTKRAAASYSELNHTSIQSGIYLEIINNHMESRLSQRKKDHSTISIVILFSILAILVFIILNSIQSIFKPLNQLVNIINTLSMSDSDDLKKTSHFEEFHNINNALSQAQKRFNSENKILKKQAYYDPLTGLLNRRGFEKVFMENYNKRKASCLYFSILLLDVDRFKLVNDTYGHSVGDEVLKHIGEILSDVMRDSDVVARYGGEEFIFAVPCASKESASYIAERTRHLISTHNIAIEDTIINITISIGLYFSMQEHMDLEQAIKYADIALYEAKKTGRNKVVAYSDDLICK